MAVIYRTWAVPPDFDDRLREAADSVLRGDWRITVLQSHLGARWNMHLEGPRIRCRIVLLSVDKVTVAGLTAILKQLANPS